VDIDGTIAFILEAQAKAEAHMGALDQRVDGIAKLVKQGMRLLVDFQKDTVQRTNALIDGQLRLQEAQQRMDARLERLADAQANTDLKFQAFLDHLKKGRNGN
jgi:hypothetical protein